jgi:hypothetical protein
MAITYTWKIVSIKTANTDSFENAIVNTYWQKIGTDEDGVSGYFAGATPFDADQIDPENFTSLNQLTEEMVIEWIKQVVVGHYEEHVNAEIARDILENKKVIVEIEEDDLPWKAE